MQTMSWEPAINAEELVHTSAGVLHLHCEEAGTAHQFTALLSPAEL